MTNKIIRNIPETGLTGLFILCDSVKSAVYLHNVIIEELCNNDAKVKIMYDAYCKNIVGLTIGEWDHNVEYKNWLGMKRKKSVYKDVPIKALDFDTFKGIVKEVLDSADWNDCYPCCRHNQTELIGNFLKAKFFNNKELYSHKDKDLEKKIDTLWGILRFCDEIEMSDKELNLIRNTHKNKFKFRIDYIDIKTDA